MRTIATALSLLLTATGCSSMWSDDLVVDGVRLKESHRETLALPEALPDGLRVSSHMGDVVVRTVDGDAGGWIEAKLHEYTPGDAHLELLDGELIPVSASGQPCALGDVSIHCRSVTDLVLATGMGDVSVQGVVVSGDLKAETGTGDVVLVDTGAPLRVVAHSGMGDIELVTLTSGELLAESGMGDLELRQVLAETAVCSSGMGDVDLRECSFGDLQATTGMGDIDCRQTTYDKGKLDSGMGKVRRETVTREVE